MKIHTCVQRIIILRFIFSYLEISYFTKLYSHHCILLENLFLKFNLSKSRLLLKNKSFYKNDIFIEINTIIKDSI